MEKNKFENFSAKESTSDENIGIIDFSRPSDFRLKAVKTKKIQFVNFVLKKIFFLETGTLNLFKWVWVVGPSFNRLSVAGTGL